MGQRRETVEHPFELAYDMATLVGAGLSPGPEAGFRLMRGLAVSLTACMGQLLQSK